MALLSNKVVKVVSLRQLEVAKLFAGFHSFVLRQMHLNYLAICEFIVGRDNKICSNFHAIFNQKSTVCLSKCIEQNATKIRGNIRGKTGKSD